MSRYASASRRIAACREASRRATSGQQPVKRTDLLKTDLDEIKGSEMNVWVADIAPGAATGKGCVLKIVKATFQRGTYGFGFSF
jgi:hypothetical protein